MNYNDIKFTDIKKLIQEQYEKHRDWEYIKSFEFHPMKSSDDIIDLLNSLYMDKGDELTLKDWEALIELAKSNEEEKKIIKLGKFIKNDVKIPNDKYSAWQGAL